MQRKSFQHDGVTLSYLDAEGDGVALIALHAYWMEAGTYADLAAALAPRWRVIALDQRGHGHSDHPADLSWEAFIGDLDVLLDHLAIETPVAITGNSLGGTVAFRYAARQPSRVSAMIIEESPAKQAADLLHARLGRRLSDPRGAAREGWRTAGLVGRAIYPPHRCRLDARLFAHAARGCIRRSQGRLLGRLAGQHVPYTADPRQEQQSGQWSDPRGHGKASTQHNLAELRAGHVVHHDQPSEFAEAVRAFLTDHREWAQP